MAFSDVTLDSLPLAAIVREYDAVRQTAAVIQIASLEQIPRPKVKPTLFLLDLDDTLIHHGAMLGSKAWRDYIKDATRDASGNTLHDLLSLYVAQNYPTVSIEPKTAHIVKELQDAGHLVFGFTARERNCWYYTPTKEVDLLTKKQLLDAGIDFSKTKVSAPFAYLAEEPACFDNIFFADTDTKGEFAIKLLKHAPVQPAEIQFFDDKEANAISVKRALNGLGIKNECYHLVQTLPFDPLIANIELYYLLSENRVVLDEEARQIAEKYPEKNEAFYLAKIIDHPRSRV